MPKYQTNVLPPKGKGWPKKLFVYSNGSNYPKYTFIRENVNSPWIGHGITGPSIDSIMKIVENWK
jgi:hypothetical protein